MWNLLKFVQDWNQILHQKKDELLEDEEIKRRKIERELEESQTENKRIKSENMELMKANDDFHASVIRLEHEKQQLNDQLDKFKTTEIRYRDSLMEKMTITPSQSYFISNDEALEGSNSLEKLNETSKSDVVKSNKNESAGLTDSYSCGSQTRIRKKDMEMMLSLKELHEDCAALLVWDASHNSYIAYSTSQVPYFVNDESLSLFGIQKDVLRSRSQSTDPQPPPLRNWMFAQVRNIETCQIKKASNRYNLPVGTRFNRILVVPFPEYANNSVTKRV